MGLTTPNLNYKSIKINGQDIALSSTTKVSFRAPYNRIDITFTPDCSLSYYEVRVTKEPAEYDIGIGNLAYQYAQVIYSGTDHSYSINVNPTLFDGGNAVYRISLYARSMVDGSWDVTYLFFTSENEQLIPTGSSGLEVLTDREPPNN